MKTSYYIFYNEKMSYDNNNNNNKILVNNYVPTKPKVYNENDKGDLDSQLQLMNFNEIISDLYNFFEKPHITNLDLIHNECKGNELKHDRQYFETLFLKKIDSEFNNLQKHAFVSSAQRCESKDVFI